MTGLALLAVGLLLVPIAVWSARWTTRNATLFLVITALLLSLWAPRNPSPILTGTLNLLLPFLLFRIGGLARLEDLRSRQGISWLLFSVLTLFGVFLILAPVTHSASITWRLAVFAMAPGPVLALALTREFTLHGPATRAFHTGIVIQSLAFAMALMGIQGPHLGMFAQLERFLTLTVVSLIAGVGIGFILAYAETKIVHRAYLRIFTLGTLLTTMGLLWKLSIPPALTFLILGVVTYNASIRDHASYKSVSGFEVPAMVLFILGSFWSTRPLSDPLNFWILFAYGMGRIISRGVGSLLFFPREDSLSRSHLFGLSFLQGGTSLWLLSPYLGETFHPKLAVSLFAVLGLALAQRVLRSETGAFHPFLETPLFTPGWTGIFRHLLENLGWQGPRKEPRYVRDLMRKHYRFVRADDPLETIVKALTQSHTLAIPVVGPNQEYIGLIQAHHLELLALDETTRHLIKAVDLANPQYVVAPDLPLGIALHTMEKFDLDCLPVVENRRILGVLYRRDVVLEYG